MASPSRVVVCAFLALILIVAPAFGPESAGAGAANDGAALVVGVSVDGLSPISDSSGSVKSVLREGAEAFGGEARQPTHTMRQQPAVQQRPADPVLSVPEIADIPQVNLEIVLNYPDRRLHVTHRILLANTTPDRWDEVVFSVLPARVPGLFMLEQVEVVKLPEQTAEMAQRSVSTEWLQIAGHQDVATTLDGIMLEIAMPTPVLPGEPVLITLVYAVRVPRITPTTGLPEGNLGAGEHVIQVGDWHPTLAPYVPGSGWQRWAYHHVGDPVIYPLADYDVRLYADAGVVVAAPGFETRQGLVRRYQLPRARCFAFLAGPDYRSIEADAEGVPIRVYYLPGNAGAAQAAADAALRAIVHFDDLFGPYPTAGLVIAQNAYGGSMEYSGLVSISAQAFQVYNGSPQALLISLVVHEVAHQWWYGAVGNDQVHEPWLDEAPAKYSELLYYERYAPDLVRWWWETLVRQQIADGHTGAAEGLIHRTIYDFDSTFLYVQQIYGQGARFLADLRSRIGDESFFAFLRDYGRSGAGQLMRTEDFFRVLRSHTDHDLGPLIEGYFGADIRAGTSSDGCQSGETPIMDCDA